MMLELDHRDRILSRPSNLDFLLARRAHFLREHLNLGDRVLEVGAGYGIVSLYVDGVQLVTTDVRYAPWITTVADVMALPFADEMFDAVVCLNVLHHVEYPRGALEEMVRVLHPGGRILISEPHLSLTLRAVLLLARHEYVDRRVDPFGTESCQTGRGSGLNGNNAIGDLLFDDMKTFCRAFPELSLEYHRLIECVTFLNSGGVEYRTVSVMLPRFMLEWLGVLDDWLARFPRLFPICRQIVLRKRAIE
ncbi:MAG: class I SAM-dependent methyltransferase [Gammaproteobacteria bacterium]|nr:class I SAM-dependent methyltransferase [Gammaproteobacteria bacterium]